MQSDTALYAYISVKDAQSAQLNSYQKKKIYSTEYVFLIWLSNILHLFGTTPTFPRAKVVLILTHSAKMGIQQNWSLSIYLQTQPMFDLDWVHI